MVALTMIEMFKRERVLFPGSLFAAAAPQETNVKALLAWLSG